MRIKGWRRKKYKKIHTIQQTNTNKQWLIREYSVEKRELNYRISCCKIKTNLNVKSSSSAFLVNEKWKKKLETNKQTHTHTQKKICIQQANEFCQKIKLKKFSGKQLCLQLIIITFFLSMIEKKNTSTSTCFFCCCCCYCWKKVNIHKKKWIN